MPNPDGTKQVSPPTRSAFAPEAKPVKAGPVAKATADKSDTDGAANPHETSILEGIKGLIRQHSVGTSNKNEASALEAVNTGVADAPGRDSDY